MECKITVKDWGLAGTEPVKLYTLSNGPIEIAITNYGATLVAAWVPDRQGQKANVVAGFDALLPYTLDHPYLGCMVGRYCNRIAGGRFAIDGQSFQLTLNEAENHLHGGFQGLSRKVWKEVSLIQEEARCGLRLRCESPDGEEGYPGRLVADVTYLLDRTGQLHIHAEAATDEPTIVNLTNHSYFNLTGFAQENIYEHHLQVMGRHYTVKGTTNTPTGEIAPVAGTPLDFSSAVKVGDRIGELPKDRGYDHNYVLGQDDGAMALAAHLCELQTGRSLKVYTDQPGLQVYTANWWDGRLTGQQGRPYQLHGAIALETQGFPDAPNHPHFPTQALRPGERYQRKTIFAFSQL